MNSSDSSSTESSDDDYEDEVVQLGRPHESSRLIMELQNDFTFVQPVPAFPSLVLTHYHLQPYFKHPAFRIQSPPLENGCWKGLAFLD